MRENREVRSRRVLSCFALVVCTIGSACDDDPTRPSGGEPREYAVVLNSVSNSLTVFPVDAPDSTRTIALGPTGTPTTLDVRGSIALVPLGLFPALAVVDLADGVLSRTIPLPEAGGATGVAIANDSVAFVGNPELNTISPVRYRAGTAAAEIAVGRYPTALAALGDRIFVLEANLVDFVPDGPSTVSVVDADEWVVDADFTLSGRNAGDALVLGDSIVLVLNRGDFGAANGSLSVIRLPIAAEAEHNSGFGEGTGTLALLEDGQLAVSSWAFGIALFDLGAGAFTIAPSNGVVPEGAVNVLAAAADGEGRLHVVSAGDCAAPGSLLRLDDALQVAASATVGSCPIDVAFTTF
ncbi:MAG TPA: hypothetical protein VMN78_01100 [Longimicrobiales bacterium]|nr:hypothetical protein [Longimicrobiales bacterium]